MAQPTEADLQSIVSGLLLSLAEIERVARQPVPDALNRMGHQARVALSLWGARAYAAGLVDPSALPKLATYFQDR